MLVALDFEFNRPSDPDMGLISCALEVEGQDPESYWLRDEEGRGACIQRLQGLASEEFTLVTFTGHLAEIPCLIALGLNPLDFVHRDLALEWRWLRNNDGRFNFGRQVSAGVAAISHPPTVIIGKHATEAERDYAERVNQAEARNIQKAHPDLRVVTSQVGWTLLDCLYTAKLLTAEEYVRADAEKDEVRDGIILGGDNLGVHRQRILDYNVADISLLIPLAKRIGKQMVKVGAEPHMHVVGTLTGLALMSPAEVERLQIRLGWWSSMVGVHSRRGIPLHHDRMTRLLEVAPQVIRETQDAWVADNPDYPIYRYGGRGPSQVSPYLAGEITMDEKLVQQAIASYCRGTGVDLITWPLTGTGRLDTSAKVLDRFSTGDNLPKRLGRLNKAVKSLATFTPKRATGSVEALRYIGPDWVQHPDFSPCGTQTGRNAAKATSFLFAGPKWLRAMVDSPAGMALIDLDYASEEFWIQAVLGNDDAMRSAYRSGDVYLAAAQRMAMYPADLPIPTEAERAEDRFQPFKRIRQVAKCIVLGMGYGAGAASIAQSVRTALHDSTVTDDQGRQWVDDYKAAFAAYYNWVALVREHYRNGHGIVLANGWRLGPDCLSALSYGNAPIQGTGACILQRACDLLEESGIQVIATLHDAVTILAPGDQAEVVATKATEMMVQAAEDILGECGMRVGEPEIIRHGDIWIHGDQGREGWERVCRHFEQEVRP